MPIFRGGYQLLAGITLLVKTLVTGTNAVAAILKDPTDFLRRMKR